MKDKASNLYILTEKGRKELKILAEKSAVYLPWLQQKKFVNPRIINCLAEGL
jgi:DNA-binding PadR family transcriptional regulator